MTWRTGLGMVDIAVLEALAGMGATAGRPRVKTATAVGAVDRATGLGPDLSYELLLSLGRAWMLQVPLVDFQGNIGSPDDGPAPPRYNEVRLSATGELAAGIERSQTGAVPVGLINGNVHRGGTEPPFAPGAVVSALRRLARPEQVDDSELLHLIGAPSFPSGCDVVGDLTALLAGEETRFQMIASVTVRPGSATAIEIRHLPPGIGADEVVSAIETVAGSRDWHERHRRLAEQTFLPISSIVDESRQRDTVIVCTAAGGRPEELVEALRRLWPVQIGRALRLPGRLTHLLRRWPGPGPSDVPALLDRFEDAMKA